MKWRDQYGSTNFRYFWGKAAKQIYRDDIDVINHPEELDNVLDDMCFRLSHDNFLYLTLKNDPNRYQRKLWKSLHNFTKKYFEERRIDTRANKPEEKSALASPASKKSGVHTRYQKSASAKN